MKKVLCLLVSFLALVSASSAHAFGHTWRYSAQQNPSQIASFTATDTRYLNTGTALYSLPPWLSISCATTGRTTQTSSATLVKGLGANAARARNVSSGPDATKWGLSVEPARVQLAKLSQLDNTWGFFGGCTFANTTGPDGANTAALLTDPGGSIAEAFKNSVFSVSAGTQYTLSVWSGPSTRSAGNDFTNYSINGMSALLTPNGNAAAWARLALTFTASGAGVGWDILVCAQSAANTGNVAVGEVQVEAAAYPTSLIPNASGSATLARAADVLISTPTTVAPAGDFDVDFTFAPNYANTEQAADQVLLYFDANDQIFLQQSTGKIVERIGGSGHDVLSSALTWSREDAIRVVASHLPSGLSLAVYKNGSQQGTTQTGSAQSAISLPASVGLLGNATTSAEAADLRALTIYRR